MSVLSATEIGGREVRSLTVRARATAGGELVSFGGLRTAGGRRRGNSMAAGQAAPGSAGGLRLTKRGRALLAGLAIMAVTVAATGMLFWLSIAGGAQAASHGQRPGAVHLGMSRVIVQPGQTLWSIAQRAEPSADPRIVVRQIIEVNALGSPLIQPGELLWVPKG